MSSQTKLIKDILSIYDTILENKSLGEAASNSDELLGGEKVTIPADGGHKGQSGWQSNNAWDIQAKIGAPVYALADGVVQTFNDYGQNATKTGGKILFGQSFTVTSDNNLPSVYYTHLQGSPITRGAKIKCGQLLGYVMDFPNNSYDHVHIGVENGNIRQFLNDDGTLKCSKGSENDGSETEDSSNTDNNYSDSTSKNQQFISRIAKPLLNVIGLSENIEKIKKLLK